MTLESWRYGDPAMVLERQGETCEGCRHLEQWDVAGAEIDVCGKRPTHDVRRRCDGWKPVKIERTK